jgi:hypothetical protein
MSFLFALMLPLVAIVGLWICSLWLAIGVLLVLSLVPEGDTLADRGVTGLVLCIPPSLAARQERSRLSWEWGLHGGSGSQHASGWGWAPARPGCGEGDHLPLLIVVLVVLSVSPWWRLYAPFRLAVWFSTITAGRTDGVATARGANQVYRACKSPW